MIDNCPICGHKREHYGVVDMPEIKRRLYMAHCTTEGCEQWMRAYTYQTKRDEFYHLDRIEKLRELGVRIDTINALSNRVVKARRAYEITVGTSKGASKTKGKRWTDLLAQLEEHYNDVCAWATAYAVTTPPVPEGMRQ